VGSPLKVCLPSATGLLQRVEQRVLPTVRGLR
jgi:hypothetical protein